MKHILTPLDELTPIACSAADGRQVVGSILPHVISGDGRACACIQVEQDFTYDMARVREIRDALAMIELHHNVTILYACEAGSRAWGMQSSNSDFDVRYIYAHRPRHYLDLDLARLPDTLESQQHLLGIISGPGPLDVCGWDLAKALRLFRGGNPPLLEWLQSPIVYRDIHYLRELLLAQVRTCYSPASCLQHYWHMAKGNRREYLTGPDVWLKKQLYVIRPLLAMRHLEYYPEEPVPVRLDELARATLDDNASGETAYQALQHLLQRKRAGEELGRGPRDPVLGPWIDAEFAEHESAGIARPTYAGIGVERPSSASRQGRELQTLFLDLLEELEPTFSCPRS